MKKKVNAMILTCAFAVPALGMAGALSADATEVAIDQETFPDANLFAAAQSFDEDGNETLSDEELQKATELVFDSEKKISDASGISNFKYLSSLTIKNGDITSLDLSSNNALQTLTLVSDAELSNLKVNPELVNLIIGDCTKIASLDLTTMPKLDMFYCASMLPEINFGEKSSLTQLCFADAKIGSFDLSVVPELVSFGLINTDVTEIDLSKAEKLKAVEIDLTPINSIVLNKNLETLGLIDTELKSLDISECESLVNAYKNNEAQDYKDKYIDKFTGKDYGQVAEAKYWGTIPTNVLMTDIEDIKTEKETEKKGLALTTENFSEDLIASLEKSDADKDGFLDEAEIASVTELAFVGAKDLKGIENLTALKSLTIAGCEIKSIDLTVFPALEKFYIASTPAEVNYGETSGLKYLAIADSTITELDLSKFPKLETLGLLKTGVTSVDLSKTPELTGVEIDNTPLTSIVLNDKLVSLALINTKLDSIDISACETLVGYYKNNEVKTKEGPIVEPVTGATLGESKAKYWGEIPNCLMTDIENIVAEVETPELTGVEGFVTRLYTEVLGREPDKSGIAYWTEELTSKRLNGGEVAQGFIFSPEFISSQKSDEEFLNVLYKVFFDRVPDASGLKYWKEQLSTKSMDRSEVTSGFIYSQEWADICGKYGIRSGGYLEAGAKAEPSELVNAFVERLYTTALGRASDKEGKAYWASELANQTISGETIGAFFFLSDEFKGYNLSDEEFVRRLYLTFMDRESDAEGKKYWLDFLKDHEREQAVFGFTRSSEFADRCSAANILPF